MKKKAKSYIKLQIPAGKANPSPPIGPALGQHGLNIMEFCKAFNAASSHLEPGLITTVVIAVYADKSFTFEVKSPPVVVLLKKVLGIQSGSGRPNLDKVGTITLDQLKEVVGMKSKDMTAASEQAAMRTVLGTARSMGIVFKGDMNVASE